MRNVAFGCGGPARDRRFVTDRAASIPDGRGRASLELQGGGSIAGGGLDIMSRDAAMRTAAPQGVQIDARLFSLGAGQAVLRRNAVRPGVPADGPRVSIRHGRPG